MTKIRSFSWREFLGSKKDNDLYFTDYRLRRNAVYFTEAVKKFE